MTEDHFDILTLTETTIMEPALRVVNTSTHGDCEPSAALATSGGELLGIVEVVVDENYIASGR